MAKSRSQLHPYEVFVHAFQIAAKEAKGTPEAISLDEKNSQSYAAKFSYSNDKKAVLLCPTSDTNKVSRASGGARPFLDSLSLVEREQTSHPENQPPPLFIIPLCEARPYSGFIPWARSWLSWLTCGVISPFPEVRTHWTLLTIEGTKCHFYDPKGTTSSWVYSLEPITTALQSKGFTLTEEYLGWQSWDNETHDSFYVGDLITRKLTSFTNSEPASSAPNNASTCELYDTMSRDISLQKKYSAFLAENSGISKNLKKLEATPQAIYVSGEPSLPTSDTDDPEEKKGVSLGSDSKSSKGIIRILRSRKLEEYAELKGLLGEPCKAITDDPISSGGTIIKFNNSISAEEFATRNSEEGKVTCKLFKEEVMVSADESLDITAAAYLLQKKREGRKPSKQPIKPCRKIEFPEGKPYGMVPDTSKGRSSDVLPRSTSAKKTVSFRIPT